MPNILTPEQITLVASKAGFKGDNLVTIVAIALAESGGDALAIGDSGMSFGLWQINAHAHPDMIPGWKHTASKEENIKECSKTAWYDPFLNARFAYKLSGGGGFSPWSVYIHDTYKTKLNTAKLAVNAYLTNPSQVKPPLAIAPNPVSVYPNKKSLQLTKPYMRDGVNGITGIRKVQQKLISLGFSCGPDGADGIYGKNTAAAVTAFKVGKPGLTVPGIVGPETWEALFKA
jgi:Lysozyme like domain/Putative peptidoglycan binding domain